jgi:hypothetical protein
MTRLTALAFLTGLLVLVLPVPDLEGQVSFPGPELLGRPTNSSVAINIVPGSAIDAYFEYGTQSGQYTSQTATVSTPANEPLQVVIGDLQANTRYFYRMVYRQTGTSSWTTRDEHSFYTQRSPGSTFTFTVISDSHVNIILGNANLYTRTLQNVGADKPDFHLDLGDTFAMDNVTTQTQAYNSYLSQRSYMGLISHSAPVFLALGNHEQEEGWHLDDTGNPATSQPVMGANARKRYFLNPVPDSFYSGNISGLSAINGDGLRGDYYAWEWGDALFVVIDPFWYTTTKPFTGSTGGGESSDVGSGDRWDWTLGLDQYQWLKRTLENSHATYKFVFAHHVTGGTEDYVRGGANAVPYCEWGGYNEDGKNWGFDTRRPGWYATVHELLVENHVTAFFHGHDHEFAYEQRDGVVYQEIPMPSDSGYGYGFNLYRETDPYTIRVLPNSGHLRVTVSPTGAVVDYVRAFLSGAGTNGQVAYTYTMTGTGTGGTPSPTVTLSPTSLAFGNQTVGTTGTAQTVTLTNTGNAMLTITGIAFTGTNSSDFAQTNTCGTSVGAGATCTISVTFKPMAAGSRTASVSITDNAAGSPHSVGLTGTGVTSAPAVSLSPTSLAFGNQTVGTTSTARALTLTNTGSATLTITSIALTGINSSDFAQTNTCGTSVSAGATCTISVTFRPMAAGSRTASVSITDNATGSPHSVGLTGTGVSSAPAVSLSPTSLAFGNQTVGTTSTARAVTLTNTGSATLTITSIALTGTNSGDFAQTNTCGTSVGAGAKCTISVTFKPTAAGSRTASVSTTDNATGSPHTISLAGTGVAAAAAVSLSPTSLAFGNQTVGTTSTARAVTLTNTGSVTLTITSIALTGTNSGDFAQTNTCGTSVGAGAKCTITVTFKPTSTGSRTASVSITDSATGSPHKVSLTGSGVAAGRTLTMTPSPLSFGNQAVGTISGPLTLTLTNSGGTALTLLGGAITGTNSGDFTATGGNCSGSLAAGASCQVTMTFKPSAAGARTASLVVTSNATNSPTTVALAGTGQ